MPLTAAERKEAQLFFLRLIFIGLIFLLQSRERKK